MNWRRFTLSSIKAWHSLLSRCPPLIPRIYISLASVLCRHIAPRSMGKYIEFAICHQGVVWPSIRFNPRRVVLGENVEVLLHPHLGEPDAQALFVRRMTYEQAVFTWLERNVDDYDLIIEVGANVGIYSCFFGELARRKPQPHRVICFEPSPLAFVRLEENLLANKTEFVIPVQAAISTGFGVLDFFEPRGHLTNGSLLKSFSEIFSSQITRTSVLGLDVLSLRKLAGSGRTLVKLDVEGYEPALLQHLKSDLAEWTVDLVIEVLDITCGKIADALSGLGFGFYLIKGDKLEKFERLFASEEHRDWFITRSDMLYAVPDLGR